MKNVGLLIDGLDSNRLLRIDKANGVSPLLSIIINSSRLREDDGDDGSFMRETIRWY